EAERFATTERAYRRVVSEVVEKGLIVRSSDGLKPVDMDLLEEFVESFSQI
ncbi:Crp/Fnr family transcriptional regulator, partial [Pseudoalteromonas piscicida]